MRGGWSQTFRAPDMFNIYGKSKGFSAVYDLNNGIASCYDENQEFVCGATPITQTRSGDTELREEYGDESNLGFVWQPFNNLGVSVSWYKMTLNDLVITENAQELVARQYSCNSGDLNPNSASCRDADERITRDELGTILDVTVKPVNQDSLVQQGIDIQASYRLETDSIGSFGVSVSHSKYLDFEIKRFEDEEAIDLRYGEIGASQPASFSNLALSWNKKLEGFEAVGASLFVSRQGPVKNYFHTQAMKPYYNSNLSGFYKFSARFSAQFSIANLLDTKPELHDGGVWPNYWAHIQDASGRAITLSMSYQF